VSTTNNVKDHGHNEGPADEKALPHHHPVAVLTEVGRTIFEAFRQPLGRTVWLAGGAAAVDERLIGPTRFRSQRVFFKKLQSPENRSKTAGNAGLAASPASCGGHDDESPTAFRGPGDSDRRVFFRWCGRFF
ncbi:hypothetical protein, partial [Aurantimonas sp. 22II-16-19i]|uniref:hypothetical protein n=1 Tax=Aurantimonas sp. 22II-16-19i TaxID=1317114 RepID=UPI001AECAC3B